MHATEALMPNWHERKCAKPPRRPYSLAPDHAVRRAQGHEPVALPTNPLRSEENP